VDAARRLDPGARLLMIAPMTMSFLSRRGFLFGAFATGLTPVPFTRLASPDGAVFAEGLLDIFLAGTTTPAPAFADAALSIPLPNPVRANALGILPAIFLDPALVYRLRGRTRLGSVIAGMDFDQVPGAGASPQLFRQNDRHAVARPAAAKLGDFVSVLDFHDPAAGNDITRALELLAYEAFPDLPALNIQLPAGHFRVGRQLLPARQLNIRGAGMSATILDFHNVGALNRVMRGAISLGLLATCRAYDPDFARKVRGDALAYGTNGTALSTIESLTIRISGSRPPDFHYGIWSAAPVVCRDVVAHGCGFKWCGSALQAGRGNVVGNANLSHFSNCHSVAATEHGFMADGTDANACTITACNAFSPAQKGFFDASFLGNSYEGCHASGGTGGYTSIAPAESNRSVFTGCYCEPDAGDKWNVAAPGVIVNPKGAMPDARALRTNVTLAPTRHAGFATGSAINLVPDLDPYTFGSSRTPAARVFPGGMVIRGQGDGDLYQFVAAGQHWGGVGTPRPGASIIKRDGDGRADHELVWFGDPRHRPAFPAGMIASLPGPFADNRAARAAGLTPGEFYRQTATNLVAVVV